MQILKSFFYVFFWVFPRRPIVVCRRFGTLYQFHLQGLDVKYTHPLKMEQIECSETSILHTSYPAYEDGTDSVPKRRYFILHIQPMKMELIECSETSAYNNQTPGKYPKEYTHLDSKHGESLKTRI